MAEVGSKEVGHDLEVRALRARVKRAEQELDMLKRLGHLLPTDPVSTYQHIARLAAHVPVRQCQVLYVASAAYYA
jgi:hypothetical protein